MRPPVPLVSRNQLVPENTAERVGGTAITQSGPAISTGPACWSIISGLTAPIFDGGTLRAEKRRRSMPFARSAANYEQTVLERSLKWPICSSPGSRREQLDAQVRHSKPRRAVLTWPR